MNIPIISSCLLLFFDTYPYSRSPNIVPDSKKDQRACLICGLVKVC